MLSGGEIVEVPAAEQFEIVVAVGIVARLMDQVAVVRELEQFRAVQIAGAQMHASKWMQQFEQRLERFKVLRAAADENVELAFRIAHLGFELFIPWQAAHRHGAFSTTSEKRGLFAEYPNGIPDKRLI